MLPPVAHVSAMSPITTKKIYVNPDFNKGSNVGASYMRIKHPNTHINPKFLRAPKVNSIHMNPEFLLKQQEFEAKNRSMQLLSQSAYPSAVYNSLNAQNVAYSAPVIRNDDSAKIISKSLRKIVRQPMVQRKTELSPKSIVIKNRRKLVRLNEAAKNNVGSYNPNLNIHERNQIYKLTRYSLSRTTNPYSSEVKNLGPCSTPKYLPLQAASNPNKKLQLININGVLYKSTKNKLQRKDTTNVTKHEVPSSKVVKKAKMKNKSYVEPPIGARTLFVRGTKFVMDAEGFKLTRIQSPSSSENSKKVTSPSKTDPNRIDIGGITYIRSQIINEYVRTRTHLALAHLNNAKQRSVMLLSRNFFKTNIPCPIFQRLGKCMAHERGRCNKLHDKKQIFICPRFLKGDCNGDKCLLSHEVSFSKMPVCKFFLQGICVRLGCPYLHKKLGEHTSICDDFRRGFCERAEMCNKRHVFQCVQLKRYGKCENKYCLSCAVDKVQIEKQKTENSSSAKNTAGKGKSESHRRYFLEMPKDDTTIHNTAANNDKDASGAKILNADDADSELISSDGSNTNDELPDDAIVACQRKRRKMPDVLPAFIPLS